MTDLAMISNIWNTFVGSNALNFVVFILVFALIFKKVDFKGMLESFSKKIADMIEAAKKAREDAHSRLKDVEKSVEGLPKELEAMEADASASAEIIEKKLLDEAQKQAEQIKVNAMKVIEAEEKMLTSKLTKRASKASIEVAKAHINNVLAENPQLHEKYINESIDELDRLNF